MYFIESILECYRVCSYPTPKCHVAKVFMILVISFEVDIIRYGVAPNNLPHLFMVCNVIFWCQFDGKFLSGE